jgi:3-oxoadipate enol-lactonase
MPNPAGESANPSKGSAAKGNIAKVNAAQIHYELSGPENLPTLVLSNSLGTNLAMWDTQMEEFGKHFRVLRYDTRGHGQSQVTPGPYSFDMLGRDVLALADDLGIGKFSFCGLSMGGVTGMWLGANASYRLQRLVLCSTAAKIGSAETWNARIEALRKGGAKSIAGGTMERWFTAAFREREPQTVARIREMVESTSKNGYIACCEALREADFRESLKSIRTPTLVISGTHDPATTPADGRFIAEEISGAQHAELDAAHMCNIEQAERFTKEVCDFLNP